MCPSFLLEIIWKPKVFKTVGQRTQTVNFLWSHYFLSFVLWVSPKKFFILGQIYSSVIFFSLCATWILCCKSGPSNLAQLQFQYLWALLSFPIITCNSSVLTLLLSHSESVLISPYPWSQRNNTMRSSFWKLTPSSLCYVKKSHQ